MNKVFIDMDGPLVAFDKYAREHAVCPQQDFKKHPRIYWDAEPTEGAIESVFKITLMGLDVYFATKPPVGVPDAYAAKAAWIMKHFPCDENSWVRKLIITSNKGILGDQFDFLIDDRPEKANCREFPGTLMVYNPDTFGWDRIIPLLNHVSLRRGINNCLIGHR